MSKNDILTKLQSALNDPGSQKSGEYLEEHVSVQLKRSIGDDRVGVVQALESWLEFRKEPQTMIAVRMAAEFQIQELRPLIEKLAQEIEKGDAFLPFYKRWTDEALEKLM